MTQKEAIEIIKKCKEKGFKHTFYTVNEYDTALDMAIKALRRDDTFFDKVLEIIDAQVCCGRLSEYAFRKAVLALKGELI